MLARIALDGYLAKTGWLRSASTGEVVDADGRPLPWATLPFVEFIGSRLKEEWRVFEYGAGASTRYFAERVAEVIAVEHDKVFAAQLMRQLPKNARVEVRDEGSDGYFDAIATMASPEIISIDGRNRARCAEFALRYAPKGGVIIFDDTERPQYAEAQAKLSAAGFRRIDFWGVSVGSELHRCTTIFYRSENILGI